MKRLLLALLAAAPAAAHDFWLQPADFWPAAEVETAMTLQVGHGPYRQRSPIPPSRITRFGAAGPADADLRLDGLRFQRPGLYVLALETDDRAQSHLPAIRFNDYLAAEGLTPAIEARRRDGRTDRDGSEAYCRCAKAILHVGSEGEGDSATRPVGLALEIVPERDPYARPHAAALPVRVLYHGAPLAGALVKLTDLGHDEQPVEAHRTDAEGRAAFAWPDHGAWLLNVIWTEALPPSAETDFATTFSSLSFGFPP
jgi:hypothetical protein